MGQAAVEYLLLAALLLVATVTFWRAAARELPGSLTDELQSAIRCMTDYVKSCK